MKDIIVKRIRVLRVYGVLKGTLGFARFTGSM